ESTTVVCSADLRQLVAGPARPAERLHASERVYVSAGWRHSVPWAVPDGRLTVPVPATAHVAPGNRVVLGSGAGPHNEPRFRLTQSGWSDGGNFIRGRPGDNARSRLTAAQPGRPGRWPDTFCRIIPPDHVFPVGPTAGPAISDLFPAGFRELRI